MSRKEKNEVREDEGDVRQEKVRKIAIGTTVGGVLLIVFLLIVLIIQFVQMGIKNADRRRLDDLIEQQKEQLADERAVLDYIQDDFGLFWEAVDYGYKYKQ